MTVSVIINLETKNSCSTICEADERGGYCDTHCDCDCDNRCDCDCDEDDD